VKNLHEIYCDGGYLSLQSADARVEIRSQPEMGFMQHLNALVSGGRRMAMAMAMAMADLQAAASISSLR